VVAEGELQQQAISAFKTGLAAVLCVWLGNLFGLSHSYWSAVSAIVVMGSDTTLTFASCRDRIIGTAIGAFWAGLPLPSGTAITFSMDCQFEKAGRLAAVALSIIVLVEIDGGPAQAAVARFLEVGLGIVIALAVTLLVFPQPSTKTETRPPLNSSPDPHQPCPERPVCGTFNVHLRLGGRNLPLS
jgi:uncharacterized membrane protein YccC